MTPRKLHVRHLLGLVINVGGLAILIDQALMLWLR